MCCHSNEEYPINTGLRACQHLPDSWHSWKLACLINTPLIWICSLSRNNFINFCNLHSALPSLITTDLTLSCARVDWPPEVLPARCPSPLPISITGRVGVKACCWCQGWEGSMTIFPLLSGESDISGFPSSSCLFVTSYFWGRLKWRGPNLLPIGRERKRQAVIYLSKNIFKSPLNCIQRLVSCALDVCQFLLLILI